MSSVLLRETLDYVSCFLPHFLGALFASCLLQLQQNIEHSQGLYIW